MIASSFIISREVSVKLFLEVFTDKSVVRNKEDAVEMGKIA